MKSIHYTITDKFGIHARPAGLLVKEASKFECGVKISTTERTVDAKRIMGVMGLGVKYGNTITMAFDGPDEEEAAKALQQFLAETL